MANTKIATGSYVVEPDTSGFSQKLIAEVMRADAAVQRIMRRIGKNSSKATGDQAAKAAAETNKKILNQAKKNAVPTTVKVGVDASGYARATRNVSVMNTNLKKVSQNTDRVTKSLSDVARGNFDFGKGVVMTMPTAQVDGKMKAMAKQMLSHMPGMNKAGNQNGTSFVGGFKKAMDNLPKIGQRTTQIFYGVVRSAVAAAIPLLVVGVGAAGFAALGAGIGIAAAQVEKSRNSFAKATNVYGSYMQQVEKMATTVPTMAKSAFVDQAATIGSALRSSGWDQAAMASVSTAAVRTAANLAAKTRQPLEDVMQSITEALSSGNGESLSKIMGFEDIDSDKLDEAAEKIFGIGKKMNDLTKRQRQFVVSEIIDDRAKGSEGAAYADSENTLTGKVNKLKAKFLDIFSGPVGDQLLSKASLVIDYLTTTAIPLIQQFIASFSGFSNNNLTSMLDNLMSMVIGLIAMAPQIVDFMMKCFSLAEQMLPYILSALGWLTEHFDTIVTTLPWFIGAFAALQIIPPIIGTIGALFAGITAIIGSGAGIAITAIAAIGAAVVGLAYAFKDSISWIGKAWDVVSEKMGNGVDSIKDRASGLIGGMSIDTSTIDSAKKQMGNIGNMKVSTKAAEEREDDWIRAMNKVKIKMDKDSTKASFMRDNKRSTSMALETLSIYNV